MNHNRKPCFRTKQGLFYLFDAMGMFGAYGTILLAGPAVANPSPVSSLLQ